MSDKIPNELPGALIDPIHPAIRSAGAVFTALITVACIAWTLDVPSRLGLAFYAQQLLALCLGLALATVYFSLARDARPHQRRVPWPDIMLGMLALGANLWICLEYQRLLDSAPYYTQEVVWLSVVVILLVLEALRRCTGWALLSVVLVFIGYAFIAQYAPMIIRGKPIELFPLMSYLTFDTNALLGSPLKVGAEVVIVFLFMGDMLIRAGGGEFFIDLAMSLLGRKRGGTAKICVMGSGMFGLISGSAISSVASVGQLTIPMMIRSGYSRKDAGAIEAVGSTGGQLMPPVMGAAAFLMAEFLEVPYAEIALAAAIPAFLYYIALYWQVDLMAAKNQMPILTDQLPRTRDVLKQGWHFIVPLVALVGFLFFWTAAPEVAAIVAAIVIYATGMVRSYRGKRLRPLDLLRSLAATGRTSMDLVVTLAGAGIVIGILNVSGLGYALTYGLTSLAGGNLFLLLIITAVVALILGMGLPTSGVYILLAVLAGPALIQAGVMKIPAHMFILYFGMLSMITPPVALAAFAAANISKAGPIETGWAACRIGWAKFILPFMFVLSPTLLMFGPTLAIVFDTVTALIGIYYATCGMIGYYRRPLSISLRTLLILAGLAALIPDSQLTLLYPGMISLAGVAVGFTVLLVEYLATRKAFQQVELAKTESASS